MEIHKKLWHWCRRPIKPASTSFSRFVTPLSISILVACLIVGAILTAFMSITLFSPIMFSKSSRVESGWVPIELERIGFTGGTIVVRKIQYNPFEKGYISVTVEAQISSEENLSAYIDSRTNALNMLLDSVSPDSIIQVAITFRTPIKPEDFLSLYEASLVKFSDYAVIVTDADDSKGIEIFCHQTLGTELTEDMTHIGEGKTVEGIAGVDALMKAKALRMLQSDSRVLLIDPYGDPIANEVAEKYRSMGFSVEGPSPAYVTMWNQYAEL